MSRRNSNNQQLGFIFFVFIFIGIAVFALKRKKEEPKTIDTEISQQEEALQTTNSIDSSPMEYLQEEAPEKSGDEEAAEESEQKEEKQQTAQNPRVSGIEIPAYLTDREEEILQHTGFTISYNRKYVLPNWVAWVLTPERLEGGEKRADNFQPDESIKKGPIATTYDYRGSGYDRGHMCPAADNKNSRAAQNECFLMSNMCPQTHALNAGDWEKLENKCRTWTRKYGALYIVAGPVIRKGEKYETIGENNVAVPEKFFKVVLRYKSDNSAEAIGFIYNNDESSHPMSYYACSVDEVESATGINFYSKLPKEVERKAEATYNLNNW